MENSFVFLPFYFFTLLLFQEFVDMLQIVQTIIQEEAELRNDTQLVSHLSTQVETDRLLVGIDILQYLLTLL